MRQQLFSGRNGDRPDVKNVGIVITDGNSNTEADRVSYYIIYLTHSQVQFFHNSGSQTYVATASSSQIYLMISKSIIKTHSVMTVMFSNAF